MFGTLNFAEGYQLCLLPNIIMTLTLLIALVGSLLTMAIIIQRLDKHP